eukprot:1681314-Pleurochrysis_carterae.AAC.4
MQTIVAGAASEREHCSDTDLYLTSDGGWRLPTSCTSLSKAFQRVDVDAIATALPTSRLRMINLTWCSISVHAIASIAVAAGSYGNLLSLDLGGNWFGDAGVKLLALKLLQVNCSQLNALHLRWNGISQRSADLLASSLRSCTSLAVLDLGGNQLQSVSSLMGSIEISIPTLQALHLDYNLIDSKGLSRLPALIAAAQELRVLNLVKNKIDSLPAKLLFRARHHGAQHMVLDVRENNIVYKVRAALMSKAMEDEQAAIELLLEGPRDSASLRRTDRNNTEVWPRLGGSAARQELRRLVSDFTAYAKQSRLYMRDGGGSDRACVSALHALTERLLAVESRMLSFSEPHGASGSGHEAAPIGTAENWRPSWYNRYARFRKSQLAALSRLHKSVWQAPKQLRQCNTSIARLAESLDSLEPSGADPVELEYWRQVYPVAGPLTQSMLATKGLNFFYNTAPSSVLTRPCTPHAWSRCRLESFLDGNGNVLRLPRVALHSFFSPFRLPPGACLRSLFSWQQAGKNGNGSDSAGDWRRGYPHADGIRDFSWAEVAHTKEQTGSAWLYLTPGSGIFWNCGRSLRARNKVAAALQLTQELRGVSEERALQMLARTIESDDPRACEADHCRTFMMLLRSNRSDRNDNCYGYCQLRTAPLTHWLARAASMLHVYEWQFEHMSASSVFDSFISQWGLALGYDSVQLTMQPQVWCGIGWTTEMVDLRVRHHKAKDLLKSLSVRDPLDLSRGVPCEVPTDSFSVKAFQLCIYCQGTLMERVSRCLADASGGKPGFTVYSQYPHSRFHACISVR